MLRLKLPKCRLPRMITSTEVLIASHPELAYIRQKYPTEFHKGTFFFFFFGVAMLGPKSWNCHAKEESASVRAARMFCAALGSQSDNDFISFRYQCKTAQLREDLAGHSTAAIPFTNVMLENSYLSLSLCSRRQRYPCKGSLQGLGPGELLLHSPSLSTCMQIIQLIWKGPLNVT